MYLSLNPTEPFSFFSELGFAVGASALFIIASIYTIRLLINRLVEREKELGKKLDSLETEFRQTLMKILERNQEVIVQNAHVLQRSQEVQEVMTEALKTRPCLFSDSEVLSRIEGLLKAGKHHG